VPVLFHAWYLVAEADLLFFLGVLQEPGYLV
jgi:hypothetical protein